MEIPIRENGILLIHSYVVKHLIAVDGFIHTGMIDGSIARTYTTIEKKRIFPTIQDRAGALLYSITRFHPFADGCKRTGLLAAYLYLFYNGYMLSIPEDSASFLEKVADLESATSPKEKDVINWIKKHSSKNLILVLLNWFLSYMVRRGFDISQYTKRILEQEILPSHIRKRFRDKELEKALAKQRNPEKESLDKHHK